MKKITSGIVILSLIFTATAWSATVNLAPIGDVTTWPGTSFRWMDVADNLYSSSYRSGFTYAGAAVSLTYNDNANTFSGTLTAAGLKPNFAYQMKLVGKPESLWVAGNGDNWTNEKLGYAGRWWRNVPNPGNSSDADYNQHKGDSGYIYQGYLLFDFFTTDQQGNATVNFAADSSFHVLWATPGSTGYGTGHQSRDSKDSIIRNYSFTASPVINSTAYDTDYGSANVGIYAQWEPGRALPGGLVLPTGDYNAQFILTEESFHQSGLGGNWAGAMGADDITFRIVPIPSTLLLLGSALAGLVGIKRRLLNSKSN